MSASMVATASVIRARSSSKLARRGGTKTLTQPHTEMSRGVKSCDRGGQAIVPPRPIQATTFAVEVGRFLSSSAQVECHLVVCIKTSGIGAIF